MTSKIPNFSHNRIGVLGANYMNEIWVFSINDIKRWISQIWRASTTKKQYDSTIIENICINAKENLSTNKTPVHSWYVWIDSIVKHFLWVFFLLLHSATTSISLCASSLLQLDSSSVLLSLCIWSTLSRALSAVLVLAGRVLSGFEVSRECLHFMRRFWNQTFT